MLVHAVGCAWTMDFTNAEKADMLMVYGECRKSAVHACTVYVETYPNRSHVSQQLFINLFNQLYDCGSVTSRQCRKGNK